jgi:cytochrome b subunit of formate dehydrogenase
MSLVAIRRALHHLYTLVTLLLIVTGLLLSEPDLRARLVGGYGREILDLHIWVGVGFVVIPVLALLAAARPLGRDLRRRLGPPDGVTWRKVHTVFTLVAGAALGLSGVLLWLDPGMPLAVVDILLVVHEWTMWPLIAALAAHLVLAWRKTVARTREILGREPELHPSFEDDAFEDGER